ncbi:hypothetical protein O3M35_001213 [Rhynocoris fuscipes]|uniref:DEAD box helicase DbpA/CsdA RNA-binding domain-containing protein n=1 Tax=Rhynocoris fuscipes TaxID=488301 RepID=A0AAW1DPF4_9HEMI
MMMLTPELSKFQSYDYQELINELCTSCSYNLNSRGIKLLDETASAISLAIEKLTELEQFIADSKKGNQIDEELEKKPTDLKLKCDVASERREKKISLLESSIYFCIDENVAESHIIEALNKAGISNFVIDKLVNRINFAYGFLSFKDEESYQSVTLPNEIFIGSSILRIIPKKRAPEVESFERQKRRKKQKLNFPSKKL